MYRIRYSDSYINVTFGGMLVQVDFVTEKEAKNYDALTLNIALNFLFKIGLRDFVEVEYFNV